MEVRVVKILTANPRLTVLCKTDFGEVSVYWRGNPPVENETYDVEFEIEKLLFWDRDINFSKEKLTICDNNYEILIIGDLESIDEDGYTVLRMGTSIITFMAQGIPIEKGCRIQVRLERVYVYPIKY